MGYYYPDFVLPNGVVIEAKGYFRLGNKQKYRQIKKCFPALDLLIVFQEPTGVTAGENGAWCRKYKITFASKQIPEAWFMEREDKRAPFTGMMVDDDDDDDENEKRIREQEIRGKEHL